MQATKRRPIGEHLKEWRTRRRMSQLDFALESGISQRHLSFVESGRSAPSRDMLIHLTEQLAVPLRERNLMLLAAGYAPIYLMRSLDDPSLEHAKAAIVLLLESHLPFPALAIDRHWNVVSANSAALGLLAAMVDPELLAAPVNVMRVSLHPRGLAAHIDNLPQWRHHLLQRLRQQIETTADEELMRLLKELEGYPPGDAATHFSAQPGEDEIFVPLKLATPTGTLSFFSTTTVFGTPNDVTLSEIAIESFFPADEKTRSALLGA